MGVAVHKSGDGNHAGAVDDGAGGILRSGFGDGGDLAVGDADEGAEENVHLGIHGHNCDVGN